MSPSGPVRPLPVAVALARAARDQSSGPMLALVAVPFVVVALAWALVGLVWGDALAAGVDRLVFGSSPGAWVAGVFADFGLGALRAALPWVVLAIAALPLSFALAMLVIGVAAMPAVLARIGPRDYPDVVARGRPGWFAGLAHGLVAIALFGLAWVFTLPLWLVPPLAIAVPWVLATWLARRTMTYDALAEHATPDELRALARRHGGALWLLAGATTALAALPPLLVVAPVFSALAFAHFGLGALRALRSELSGAEGLDGFVRLDRPGARFRDSKDEEARE